LAAKFSIGNRIRALFQARRAEASLYDELEDLLIEADVGASLAVELVGELKARTAKERPRDESGVIAILKELMNVHLRPGEPVLKHDALNVFLVCGVNGVGKTTSIGKLARYYQKNAGMTGIVLGAADTFRAAAIDQLVVLGERLGVRVVRQAPNADPGAVVYDTLESAKNRNDALVIIDTSGRMHTREYLVRELAKIHKIIGGRTGPHTLYHKLLVIDTTTGQNALRQAEVFHDALGIDSLLLAKFDSSAKGGIAVAIGRNLGLPFSFVGTGESLDDLQPFNREAFLDSLFNGV